MWQPICAPTTALFPCAVAVVRISGERLATVLAPLVRLPQARVATLRQLIWGGYRERALVIYFPAPASYTGEDVVEFQVHGNPLLVRRLLEHLGGLGIRLAEPGEFTRRALLNGKQNLLESEALRDLITATTDQQIRQAQGRQGALPAWITEAKTRITPWMARAEAAVDYGEEEGIVLVLEDLKTELKGLMTVFHVEQRRAAAARWLRDGIRVALVGRPNAGKSTLFNAMAGEDRAIVTEIPGTTRDVLELRTEWAGLPLALFDTAGLRDTTELVERLGVERVRAVLEQADLILHLVPARDKEAEAGILERLEPFQGKVHQVRTMGDLTQQQPNETGETVISAIHGDLDALEEVLRARFLGDLSPDACLGALATGRQRQLLVELSAQLDLLFGLEIGSPPELVASVLQGMWGLLAALTGEDRAESALDQVFSGFCLGK